jgi:uncharacterized membrane protein (DUF4010 family)
MMLESLQLSHQLRFVVALCLGLLIGLERERSERGREQRFRAGIRTYAILSLFGFACAWLFKLNLQLALPAGLLSVAGIVVLEYSAKIKVGRVGWTSEIAALLTFAVGALSLLADIWVPLALGVVNLLLLSEKAELESYVERLDRAEFLAVVKFLLVTLIILPVLPDREFTRFRLNPVHIWEIVILVSSIGFVGHFLSKKLGSRLGLWFSGMLGGIVSSTAVSIAVGRIARKDPERSWSALQASLLASSVMYPRTLILVAFINPAFAYSLAWQFGVLTVVGLMLSVHKATHSGSDTANQIPLSENPFEIRPAVVFAGLFALLSVVTELVTTNFGKVGLMVLSAMVGVTDITPYVMSIIRGGQTVEHALVASIIVAMMSNTLVKGLYFGTLAGKVRKQSFIRYGVWTLLHMPLILIVFYTG